MSRIDITVWGHSCVRFERDEGSLVIDPGSYSDLSVLDDADAVLITHEHADHVDVTRVVAALTARPSLEAWAPADVVQHLVDGGAPGGQLHAVDGGDTLSAAGFDVVAVGHRHAEVHPSLPRAANVAYLVDGVALHPGDSFTPPPAGSTVEVLLLPVGGPWLKLAESVDYLRLVGPGVAVPIHDAVLSDVGKSLVDRVVGGLAGESRYRRLEPGETLTTTTAGG
ncbi:MAG: metal-dependent hydrolase [Actinotalea sp.]|nr:metal-dependent hydrolase [Actinotalea sp.]